MVVFDAQERLLVSRVVLSDPNDGGWYTKQQEQQYQQQPPQDHDSYGTTADSVVVRPDSLWDFRLESLQQVQYSYHRPHCVGNETHHDTITTITTTTTTTVPNYFSVAMVSLSLVGIYIAFPLPKMEGSSNPNKHNNNYNVGGSSGDGEDHEEGDHGVLSLSTGLYWSAPDTTMHRRDPTESSSSVSWNEMLGFSEVRLRQNRECPIVRHSSMEEVVVEQKPQDQQQEQYSQQPGHGNNKNMNVNKDVWWKLYTHLERPNGPVNRGRLLTTFENNRPTPPNVDPSSSSSHDDDGCGGGDSTTTRIEFEQALPRRLLHPVWHSLQVILLEPNKRIGDTIITTSNATMSPDPWQMSSSSLSSRIEPQVEILPNHFYLLSFQATVPPDSRVTLILEYEPAFLPSFEWFPGDPNRGIELPPAQALVHLLVGGPSLPQCPSHPHANATSTMLYSESLLLLPPLPDMSMPFNVWSLSCTWATFVVGAVLNTLIRRGRDKIKYALYPESKPPSKLKKLQTKLLSIKATLVAVVKVRIKRIASTAQEPKEYSSSSCGKVKIE